MDWPTTPIEQIDPVAFRPSFCPRPDCSAHRLAAGSRFAYVRCGSFRRKCDGRRVPRFFCKSCERTFSQQSFACSFYLKRPELLAPIAAGLVAGSAHRQLARSLGCAPSTVTRQAARLARHAILLQCVALDSLERRQHGSLETLVHDDFESFAAAQDFPLGVGTTVGDQSWFCYGLEVAPHRRRGKLTEAQRRRREKLERRFGRPKKGAYQRAFRRMLDRISRLSRARLTLVSDELGSYAAAVRRHPERERIVHRRYANPKRGPKGSPRSAEARERDAAMFPVDLLHSLIRHSQAHHRRETIAFARRHNDLVGRLFLLAAWRNFVKDRSERRPRKRSPAMWLGLTDRLWSWTRLLAQRLFPSLVPHDETWMSLYRRELSTPSIGTNLHHELKIAF